MKVLVKFLYRLNELHPRSVYINKAGILFIKKEGKRKTVSENFKKTYDRFIVQDKIGFIPLLRNLFHRFYGQSYEIHPPFIVRIFKLLCMPAPKISKYGSILDVGCSSGDFLYYLPSEWKKFGIEINNKAVILARKKGLNVKCVSIKSYRTKIKFDLIRACHVIEHLEGYDQFFKQSYSLLKNKGMLVIYSPNSHSLSLKLMGRYWGGFYDKTHVQIFNIDILRKIGEKYDFSLVSAKTYFTGTLIESMIRRLNIPEGRFRMFCFYIFSCIYFSLSFIQDLRKN